MEQQILQIIQLHFIYSQIMKYRYKYANNKTITQT